MRYYVLRFDHATLVKEIANIWDFKYHTPDGLGMQGYEGPVLIPPSLPELIFYGKEKAYDYASVACIVHWYLTISKRFWAFLEPYIDAPYQIWSIKVHRRKKELEYHIFHLSYPTRGCFDYYESEFYECKQSDWEHTWQGKRLYFSSFEEYIHELRAYAKEPDYERMFTIRCRKMVLDFRGMKSHLVRFWEPNITSAYFVSEELKQAMEAAKITGCRFVDPSEDDERVVAIFD